MKFKITLILTLAIGLFTYGQNLEYLKYNWEDKLDLSTYKLTDEDMVSFKEHHQKEYYSEGDYFFQIDLLHHLIWLNSDDVIENYNKVYLPFSNTSALLLSKARVVKPDGSIIELSEDKILTAQDEETKRQYKYYALEGVEKGCFIEYIYAIKSYASYKGNRLPLQSDYSKKNVSFELIAPGNLIFEFLAEDLPAVKKSDDLEGKNHWSLEVENLEPLVNESMAPYDALKKSIIYKLDRNIYSQGNGISSYDLFSQNIFDRFYGELDSKDAKEVKKIIKSLKLNKLEPEEAIRAIETYLKKNLFLLKTNDIRAFKEIIESKTATESEITRLFIQLCEALEIKSELVFTTNRFDVRFHKSFEAMNFLDAVLLYFPQVDKYTSPVRPADRLGFPFYSYMDNYGLFIKKVTVGDFTTALAKIKYIKPLGAKASTAKMDIEVSFSEDFETSNIKLSREFNGFKASHYQPYIHFIPEEKRIDVVDELLKMYGEDVEIKDYELLNIEPELFGVKPLIIRGNITYDGFVTKAGNKYIFKVGDLIGPQMELYQETERKLPTDSFFNKLYDREIQIEIPDGYEVKGLEQLNMSVYFDENQKDLDGFVSTYKVEKNKIIIDVQEFYNQIKVQSKDYDRYTKVINAAADFNKIKLIFVKK